MRKTTTYLTAVPMHDRAGLDATCSAKTSVNLLTNLAGTLQPTGTTAAGTTKLETPQPDCQALPLGLRDNNVALY